MLRTYNNPSKKHFEFSCMAINSSKITNKDTKILKNIENEINNLVSRIKLLRPGLDKPQLQLVINQHLSLIAKNILNQYDIDNIDKTKWCGIRKYTVIDFTPLDI